MKLWKLTVLGLCASLALTGCKDEKGEETEGDGDGGAGSTSNDPPSLPQPVSGDRLKQVWWQAGDAALPKEIRDSELGVTCLFSTAEDGELRCLPSGGGLMFKDADCTQAVVAHFSDPSCGTSEAPAYATTYTFPKSCDEIQKLLVWEVADAVDPPAALYRLEPSGCVEAPVDEGAMFLEAKKVPSDTFVRGKYFIDERTQDVGVRFIQAEDGAWFPDSLIDLDRDEICRVQSQVRDGKETHHCIGATALSSPPNIGDYADESCMEPSAVSFDECQTPDLVVSFEGDDPMCSVPVLREVGAPLESFYTGSSESCAAGDPDLRPGDRHHAVGALASGLIDLELPSPDGGSRLRNRYFTRGGVPVESALRAYDTSLELDCMPVPFEGGKHACIPDSIINLSANSSEVFADDACTQVLVPGWRERCDESEFAYIVVQGEDYCTGESAEVYAAGDPFQSDTVYVKNGDACEPSSTNPDSIWYQRNEKLTLDEAFVVLTEVVDD